ncbi:MAG TPA: DNA-binding transcriptional regulator, partial [Lachnospiraceae bacterium]|nr:DNA-binding transcriptional regulator [Lachnospiraceae bacterium]
MEGVERREKLISILKNRKEEPISGTELAKQLGVSR